MRDRRIKSILIFISLLWHFLILYIFFVVTRREFDEPLRITINPKTVEFLWSRPQVAPQLPSQVSPKATLMVPQPLAHAVSQVAPTVVQPMPVATPIVQPKAIDEEDEAQDRYKLKNPISGGTLSTGSLVAGQPVLQEEENLQKVEQEQEVHDSATVNQDDVSEQKEHQQENQVCTAHDVTDVKADNSVSRELNENVKGEDDAHHVVANEATHQETMLEKLESYGGTSVNGAGHQEVKSQQSQTHIQRSAPASRVIAQPSYRTKSQAVVSKQTAVKGLTLADITRGFVRNVKHEQTSTSRYTYQGAGRGPGVYAPPTSGVAMAEQIYASKIYSLLEQSALAYSRKIYARQELDMETTLEVSIDKTGKILDVVLNPSLAEKDMELALSTIVKSVGLFPPIPKQFKKHKIIVSIPLHIRSQQGFASYRLLYGMRTL